MRKSILIALATIVITTTPAPAQQAKPLDLQAALDLADKQNLDLIAARRQREVAAAGIRIAGQRPNPTASFSAVRDSPHESLFFDQPIEIGGKRGHRIDVAHQESALTDTQIAALERQVRHDTRNAYFTLAFAQADTARLGRVVELAQRLKDIAQERFSTGAVAELEVIQADLGLARAQADVQVAGQREKVALSQLNALLNVSQTAAWELSSPIEATPPDMGLPELLAQAYRANPELQQLAQQEKLEESRRNLLKAERIPDLGLEFGADFNSPRDFNVGPRGQISMMIPLFSRNQGEIAQSLASQRVLEGQTEATKRSVTGQVESGYLDVASRRTQVGLYRDKLLPATRRLEGMAEESYRAGKADILTVIDAQRNAQDVESQYLQSLFDLQSAYAALEETVGAPLP
ncbi:MAG TPA: TolC family protein [Terriglobia bacterium]|nr:TolC family protein [Terriglobia bacterium]